MGRSPPRKALREGYSRRAMRTAKATGLGNNLDFITSKGESGGGKNLCAGRDRRELFQDSLKGGGSTEHPLGAARSTPDEVCQLKGR